MGWSGAGALTTFLGWGSLDVAAELLLNPGPFQRSRLPLLHDLVPTRPRLDSHTGFWVSGGVSAFVAKRKAERDHGKGFSRCDGHFWSGSIGLGGRNRKDLLSVTNN